MSHVTHLKFCGPQTYITYGTGDWNWPLMGVVMVTWPFLIFGP